MKMVKEALRKFLQDESLEELEVPWDEVGPAGSEACIVEVGFEGRPAGLFSYREMKTLAGNGLVCEFVSDHEKLEGTGAKFVKYEGEEKEMSDVVGDEGESPQGTMPMSIEASPITCKLGQLKPGVRFWAISSGQELQMVRINADGSVVLRRREGDGEWKPQVFSPSIQEKEVYVKSPGDFEAEKIILDELAAPSEPTKESKISKPLKPPKSEKPQEILDLECRLGEFKEKRKEALKEAREAKAAVKASVKEGKRRREEAKKAFVEAKAFHSTEVKATRGEKVVAIERMVAAIADRKSLLGELREIKAELVAAKAKLRQE